MQLRSDLFQKAANQSFYTMRPSEHSFYVFHGQKSVIAVTFGWPSLVKKVSFGSMSPCRSFHRRELDLVG